MTGFKRWLLDRGLAAKRQNLEETGAVTHMCYDFLLFGKAKALLGGQVRHMLTGSAPIDKAVLDFLKICFCCPMQEGYGLTETSASGCLMSAEDTVTAHVGGPIEIGKLRLMSLPEMNYLVTDQPYPRGELLMKGLYMF